MSTAASGARGAAAETPASSAVPLPPAPREHEEQPQEVQESADGCCRVLLSREALSAERDVVAFVRSGRAGALSTFSGTTRDNFEGKRVLRLEYEAYNAMALTEMMRIAERVRGLGAERGENPAHVRVCIAHRLGLCPIGEESVIIAVSSAHRRTALAGVAVAIDDLKANVPIWKKEVYAEEDGGEVTWKENAEFRAQHPLPRTAEYQHDDDGVPEAEEAS